MARKSLLIARSQPPYAVAALMFGRVRPATGDAYFG
jgi:hypothetical protein